MSITGNSVILSITQVCIRRFWD